MTVVFTARDLGSLPIEARGLLPEKFADASLSALQSHRVFVGNRTYPLSDLFDIEGDPSTENWTLVGDLSSMHHLGEGMQRGSLSVKGSIGRHVGSGMSGGRISVTENAGDWAAAEMSGGLLSIRGSAGHEVASSYRGSPRGMTGGVVLIQGDVGREAGRKMRRGLIAIGGSAAELLGSSMLAGTIVVAGTLGPRSAAGMIRGTVLTLTADQVPSVPTFRRACRASLPMFPLLLGELRRLEFPIDSVPAETLFEVWNGDLLEGGRGELLIASAASN